MSTADVAEFAKQWRRPRKLLETERHSYMSEYRLQTDLLLKRCVCFLELL